MEALARESSSLTQEGLRQNLENHPVSRRWYPSLMPDHLCIPFFPLEISFFFFSTPMIKHGHSLRFGVCTFCILATITDQLAYRSKNSDFPGRESKWPCLAQGSTSIQATVAGE